MGNGNAKVKHALGSKTSDGSMLEQLDGTTTAFGKRVGQLSQRRQTCLSTLHFSTHHSGQI